MAGGSRFWAGSDACDGFVPAVGDYLERDRDPGLRPPFTLSVTPVRWWCTGLTTIE